METLYRNIMDDKILLGTNVQKSLGKYELTHLTELPAKRKKAGNVTSKTSGDTFRKETDYFEISDQKCIWQRAMGFLIFCFCTYHRKTI